MSLDRICVFVLSVVSLCIAFYQLGRTTLRNAMKQEVSLEFANLNTKIDSLVFASKAKDATIADLQSQLANADQSGEVIAALKVSEAKIDAALPPVVVAPTAAPEAPPAPSTPPTV